MKLKIIIYIFLFTACFSFFRASANEFSDAVPYFSDDTIGEITGYLSFEELVEKIVSGEIPVEENILQKIINIIFSDVRIYIGYISAVLGFCIISSCVKGSSVKLFGTSGEVAFLVCYIVVASFIIGILKTAIESALLASEEIGTFIKLSLPAYIGIVTTMGISFKATEGIFLAMVNIVSSYAGGFMIKSFMYIGVLTVVSNMTENVRLTKLIAISRQIMFWILGFLLTAFSSLTVLSGITASTLSGSGIRTIKYTIGHTVPIIGGFLSDSAELIWQSAKIFKNSFGIGSIIIVFVMCLVPVLKLFVAGFMLKITAGVCEPFCDERICNTLYGVGQTIIHIMISLVLMCVMFIMAFAVLLSV